MTILLDIEGLTDQETDHALELIYKALGDGDDDTLWDQHPSPLVRRLIELFTQRGMMRMDAVRKELAAWLVGNRYEPDHVAPRPDGAMLRWTPEELKLVRFYLTALPPDQFTLDDQMLLVDYLVHRYLPADAMRSEAEWLTTRAVLMGRVQANMAAEATTAQADKVMAAMPLTVRAAQSAFRLSPRQLATLNFAASRAADRVQKVSDDARYRLRNAIRIHTEKQTLGDPTATGQSLQTKLLDEFGALNRDWRRIAVTEAGEALNQGVVASTPPGHHLKRVEQYRGACAFCRSIDGRVMEVVPADEPVKNGDTQVWPGKTNIGRSASPKKRVGRGFAERPESDRYWVAAGVQHPNCRGRWTHVDDPREGDDLEFAAWLKQTLSGQQ